MEEPEIRAFHQAEDSTGKITCKYCECERVFSRRSGLYSHLRKFHGENIEEIRSVGTAICPICDYRCQTINKLQEHIINSHPEITLRFEKCVFYTDEDFDKWKERVEKGTGGCFSKSSAGRLLSDGRIATYYYCHRSGKFKENVNNRHTRNVGTVKMGKTCPACIKSYRQQVDEAIEIQVEFQSIHIGHLLEAKRTRLSKSDRLYIANLLKQGVPRSKIISDTRKKFPPMTRLGVISKQDVHNIYREYVLGKNILDKSDIEALNAKVKKLKNSKSIVLYKPLDEELSGYPEIKKEDFLLGIMNAEQLRLFEVYGSELIIIDTICVLSSCGYELTAIMVSIDNVEAFPVAILYSTKKTPATFEPFFNAIKDKLLSPDFHVKCLMSEDTTMFYGPWRKVFGEAENFLIPSSNVTRTWDNHLNLKVKDDQIRATIRSELHEILNTSEKLIFDQLTEYFIAKYFPISETQSFTTYIVNNYLNRTQQWANWFRAGLNINQELKIEKWHKYINHESCDCIVKKIYKSIPLILSSTAVKLLSRVIVLKDDKQIHIEKIRQGHLKIDQMVNVSLTEMEFENVWNMKVEKSNSVKNYMISYVTDCNCTFRCSICNACVHILSCTCIDYSIRFNICKHIHYVFQNCNPKEHLVSKQPTTDLVTDEILNQAELQPAPELSIEPGSNLEMEKAFLIADFTNLVSACNSKDEIMSIQSALATIKAHLQNNVQCH